jgi:hypothetical protein
MQQSQQGGRPTPRQEDSPKTPPKDDEEVNRATKSMQQLSGGAGHIPTRAGMHWGVCGQRHWNRAVVKGSQPHCGD